MWTPRGGEERGGEGCGATIASIRCCKASASARHRLVLLRFVGIGKEAREGGARS